MEEEPKPNEDNIELEVPWWGIILAVLALVALVVFLVKMSPVELNSNQTECMDINGSCLLGIENITISPEIRNITWDGANTTEGSK